MGTITQCPGILFAPSNHYPTFVICSFSSSTSTPCGSEPEGGRRPPPLGGQNIVSLYSVCLFPVSVFNVSLQDERFLPKNSIADVSWCSWSFLNRFPNSTIRMLCLLIHWVTHRLCYSGKHDPFTSCPGVFYLHLTHCWVIFNLSACCSKKAENRYNLTLFPN